MVKLKFLNQERAGLRPVHAWFFEIHERWCDVSVCECVCVSVCVCLCVCVCACVRACLFALRELMTSHVKYMRNNQI